MGFSNGKDKAVQIVVGVLLLIAAFPLFRFLRSQYHATVKQEDEIKADIQFHANSNPTVSQHTAEGIAPGRKDIQAAAAKLAHDFGTAYKTGSWSDYFNEHFLTENDKSAADTIIYQRRNFWALERLYHDVFTKGQNLRFDILKYLDADQLERVRKYMDI